MERQGQADAMDDGIEIEGIREALQTPLGIHLANDQGLLQQINSKSSFYPTLDVSSVDLTIEEAKGLTTESPPELFPMGLHPNLATPPTLGLSPWPPIHGTARNGSTESVEEEFPTFHNSHFIHRVRLASNGIHESYPKVLQKTSSDATVEPTQKVCVNHFRPYHT